MSDDYYSPNNAEWRYALAAFNREHGPWTEKPKTETSLPPNWDTMSLDALWHAINDQRRRK